MINGFVAGWVLSVLGLGSLARVVGWALGVVALPGMWVGVSFTALQVLVVCWLYWAVAFPSVFRGGSVRFSVILGLGSCILWLCGFAFWK